MSKVVSLRDARERKKSDAYKALVLQCFDDAEREDRKLQRDEAAKVNQNNREKL